MKLRHICVGVWGMADWGVVMSRFSRDRPRFTDTLDVIKFLCKDMWALLFRKQIDNLKTNHRVWICVLERRYIQRGLRRVCMSGCLRPHG